MANITEESLNKALAELGLAQLGLPKMWRGEQDGFWIKAIALVRKMNGDKSYYDIARDADGKISYKKDFGRMSPITGLVRIHPYQYVDDARFVNVGDAKDRRLLLISQTDSQEEREEVRTISDEEVIVRLRKNAIAMQENCTLKDIELNQEQEDEDIVATESISEDTTEELNDIESKMLAMDDTREPDKTADNTENICSNEQSPPKEEITKSEENNTSEQKEIGADEIEDWSGEAEELRSLMEGNDVSFYMDDTEALLTPADDPNDIELTEEQKNLSLEERKRIARRKYHIEKELTIRHLRNGTAFINEKGEEEKMQTIFTPQKMAEEKEARRRASIIAAAKKRSETIRKKKLAAQKPKKRGRPRKNPIEEKE